MKSLTNFINEKLIIKRGLLDNVSKFENHKSVDGYDVYWEIESCHVEIETGDRFDLLKERERTNYLQQYVFDDFKKNSYSCEIDCVIKDKNENKFYNFKGELILYGDDITDVELVMDEYDLPDDYKPLVNALNKTIIDVLQDSWMIVFDWDAELLLKNIHDYKV